MSEDENYQLYLKKLFIRDQYESLMEKICELPFTRYRSMMITHLDESFDWFDRFANDQLCLSDQIKEKMENEK